MDMKISRWAKFYVIELHFELLRVRITVCQDLEDDRKKAGGDLPNPCPNLFKG